jgi:hypothetical protein
MTINVLGLGRGLQGFSRQCGARLFSGSVLVFLITASALAATKPSQSTAGGPADVAAAVNRKCQTAVVKNQPVAPSQSVRASDFAADAPTTTVADDPDSPKTEILQDKVWSTSLSRSSKSDFPKAPQCGTTVPAQPPAN